MTVEQLKERLTTKVTKWKAFSLKEDGQLYGIIKNNNAILEVGQKSYRNSFRPVVIFQWTQTLSGTQIKGYYRISLSVIVSTLIIPLFGFYLAIAIQNVLPLLFLVAIWFIIYMTFGFWCFNKDLKFIKEEFLSLIK